MGYNYVSPRDSKGVLWDKLGLVPDNGGTLASSGLYTFAYDISSFSPWTMVLKIGGYTLVN